MTILDNKNTGLFRRKYKLGTGKPKIKEMKF